MLFSSNILLMCSLGSLGLQVSEHSKGSSLFIRLLVIVVFCSMANRSARDAQRAARGDLDPRSLRRLVREERKAAGVRGSSRWGRLHHVMSDRNRGILQRAFNIQPNAIALFNTWLHNDQEHDVSPFDGTPTWNPATNKERSQYTTQMSIAHHFFNGDHELKLSAEVFDGPGGEAPGTWEPGPGGYNDSSDEWYDFERRWVLKIASMWALFVLGLRGAGSGSHFPHDKLARFTLYDCDGRPIYHRTVSGADLSSWSVDPRDWYQEIYDAVKEHRRGYDREHGWFDSDAKQMMFEDDGVNVERQGFQRVYDDGNTINFAPCRVEVILLSAPHGSGGGGSGYKRPRFNEEAFAKNPKKFCKIAKDCGTTPGTMDCALRSLCYGYLVKHDALISNKKHVFKWPGTPNVKPNDQKSNFRKWYVKASGAVQGSDLRCDLLVMYRELDRHTGKIDSHRQPIKPEDLVGLCNNRCLGYNARITVFKPALDGVQILYTTPDLRSAVIEDETLCAIPEREDEKEDRMRDDPDAPDYIHTTTILPEKKPTDWYYLVLHNNHYYHSDKPGRLANDFRWCEACAKAYQVDRAHNCIAKCLVCFDRNCPEDEWLPLGIPCVDCSREFKSQTCYDNHKRPDTRGGKKWKGRSVCMNKWVCKHPSCRGVMFDSFRFDRRLHKHGETHWCASCQIYVDKLQHQCYIRCKDFKWMPKAYDYWFYDLETYVDHSDGGRLKCNHAQVMNADGTEHLIFNNIDQLCEFMFKDLGRELAEGELHRRFVAHNGGRFDMQFIVNHMYRSRLNFKMFPITRGNTIMMLNFTINAEVKEDDPEPHEYIGAKQNRHVEKMKKRKKILTDKQLMSNTMQVSFIDSMNFMKDSLRNLPKTYGITEIKKGDFPHHFNDGTAASYNYSGPVPMIEEFGIESYSKSRLADFIPWYISRVWETYEDREEARAEVDSVLSKYGKVLNEETYQKLTEDGPAFIAHWVFKTEMQEYCHSDVDVLRRCCMAFREQLMSIHTPIAPKSGRVQGKYYNKGDVLPSVDPFSFVTIPSYCYQGLFLRYFYEDKFLAQFDRETEQWVRKGFTGGRTETFSLYRKCRPYDPFKSMEEQDRICKVDFCSEYPFINKEGLYVGGWPVVIRSIEDWKSEDKTHASYPDVTDLVSLVKQWGFHTNKDENGNEILDKIGNPSFVNGVFFAEVSYKGPTHKKIPVIGAKKLVNGYVKFIFDLDRHDDVVVDSLTLWEAVVNNDYELFEVKKILWWQPGKVKRGIFSTYVDTFLGAKLEAGGWPTECVGDTDEHKARKETWIQEVERNNPGVKLNPANISDKKQHGKYAVAKICLNSVWGKANQRSNLECREYFNPSQYLNYYHFMADESLKCKATEIIPGKMLELRYKNLDEAQSMTPDTNPSIGVMTTNQGKLLLLRQMKKLADDQVLYVDTDSIMYYFDPENPNHRQLETRESVLGCLADEFLKYTEKGMSCREFVSGGPKNYGYQFADVSDPDNDQKFKYEMKIKGHNLSAGYLDPTSAGNIIKYNQMKALVLTHALRELPASKHDMLEGKGYEMMEEIESIPVVYKQAFRLKKGFTIDHNDRKSTYGWTYDKGMVDAENITDYYIPTVPYGYYGVQEEKDAADEN